MNVNISDSLIALFWLKTAELDPTVHYFDVN
jgi:hypothetical protein